MDSDTDSQPSFFQRAKKFIIGGALNPFDKSVFHNLSLIAFFAWVGLGADGLSSACYGPEEAFLALHAHPYLAIFVALASAVTIFVISAGYSQIIELFPSGGGGYVVASKLLSPTLGMVSGCALLVDYALTITLSIASGADALFSILPPELHYIKMEVAIAGVIFLTLLNLRGVKESIAVLLPVFLVFVATHIFVIVYTLATHVVNFPEVASATLTDLQRAPDELGYMGVLILLLRAYSMGAGTYTGIEAVSNGLPMLREPRVQTGKRTMTYMSFSLAFTVVGLMFAYILYGVQHTAGKTLNAVLFESITSSWSGNSGYIFVLVTLLSEAAILFVAAQTGFLGGPRVLSNMSLDKWFPSRFAMLSDRLVSKNGVVLMGAGAAATMILSGASVKYLVVLYAINVFITFVLAQLGMVRHWWNVRAKQNDWKKKILVAGTGLFLCTFILASVTFLKFFDGGWITVLVTGSLVIVMVLIKRHYEKTAKMLTRLDALVVSAAEISSSNAAEENDTTEKPVYDRKGKTAVFLVNGFNGLGLHTLLSVMKLFPHFYKNFIFVRVGIFDSGNFKGVEEVESLRRQVQSDLDRYINFMNKHGLFADGVSAFGTDVVEEVSTLASELLKKYPNAVFFGGQLVFPDSSWFSRWLHNYTIFSMQRRFYYQGIPIVVLPVRVNS
ncbi:MAG: APC family permease [Bacteroidota bacterium]